jgi:hypothetical protein
MRNGNCHRIKINSLNNNNNINQEVKNMNLKLIY